MDPVRQALYTRLSTTGALTALLADGAAGIHHGIAPQAPNPLVIFARQAGVDRHLFGSITDYIETQQWLVKAVTRGTSASTAEDIATQIHAALTDPALVISGRTLAWCRREQRVEYEESQELERWHHFGAIYRLILSPA